MLCSSCDAERRRLFDEEHKSKITSRNVATRSSSSLRLADRAVTRDAEAASAATTSNCSSSSAAPDTGLAQGEPQSLTDVFDGSSDGVVKDVNELLAYVCFYRDRSSVDALHTIVVGFFHPSKISEAKRRLIDLFSAELADCPLKTVRRQSTARSAHDAEVEDIIRMLQLLDNQHNLDKVCFVAVNFDRVPKYGPEEVNICAVADRQVLLDAKMDVLSNQVNVLANDDVVKKLDDQVAEIAGRMQQQLSLLTDACAQVSESLSSTRQTGTMGNVATPVDRSRNVIITGIEESRDAGVWRDTLSRVLLLAAGREIQIDDAFRLGRFHDQKRRPILVKLSSAWDRRVVLSGAHKLRGDVQFSRVFINPDEPLDVRRRNTLDRLKRKANSRGQVVLVSDEGVLSIDGIEIFCLQSGFMNRRDGANIHHNG